VLALVRRDVVVVKNALDHASVLIFLAVCFSVGRPCRCWRGAIVFFADWRLGSNTNARHSKVKNKKEKLKTVSVAVGVVLHVDVVEHGGSGGVGFFVGGDVGLMLHGGSDVVEALQ
jgi:hypothetical protein